MEQTENITKKCDVQQEQQDNYEETVAYITQIAQEFDDPFKSEQLKDHNNKLKQTTNHYQLICDGHLSELNKLYEILDQKENISTPKKDILPKRNMTESKRAQILNPSRNYLKPTDKKHNRYSVYDNTVKLPIFDATSSLLKTLVSFYFLHFFFPYLQLFFSCLA